jgi:uncharacterized protein (DUF427 family)
MSLSKGTGPFGERKAGAGNYKIESPKHVLHSEPSSKRVRVQLDGETVADSTRTKLLHETGILPVYYFPMEDIRSELLTPTDHSTHCPFKGDASYWTVTVGDKVAENSLWGYEDPNPESQFLLGHAAFYFNKMDAWFEEDEQIFVHARDPYTRIDVLPSSRHVRVSIEGEVVAETDHPVILFETSLPPRYYIRRSDIRMDVLGPSELVTQCPYKGYASHLSAPGLGDAGRDIAWCYEDPLPEVAPIADLIAFYDTKCEIEVDGEKLA